MGEVAGLEETLRRYPQQERTDAKATDTVGRLQDAVSKLDAVVRQDVEERVLDSKRLWSAIENHTHDLDVSALCADGMNNTSASFGLQEPPSAWSNASSGTLTGS